MSSTTLSNNTDSVKSPVENNDSKNDCEVSSSSKLNDFKTIESLTAKENTESIFVPIKSLPSDDKTKIDSKLIENKMSSESTSRNPLVESVSIVSNNESNRKSNNESENKVVKTPTNTQNEANNNNNNPKLRGRIAKKSASPSQMSACGWCSDNKPILKFILPTLSGENLQFCSEMCLAEFRKAVKKGACKQCGSVVRSAVAPNKDYCSLYCMNKAMPKNGLF